MHKFKKAQTFLQNRYIKTKLFFNAKKSHRTVKKRLARLGGYQGSDEEYRNQVLPFWAKYGMKPEKFWYQYFGRREKKFDPRYIPDDFFIRYLMPFFNDWKYSYTLGSKTYASLILPDLDQPTLYLRYNGGFFIDGEGGMVPADQAVNALPLGEKMIFKPDQGSRGMEIKVFGEETSREDLDQALFTYSKKGDFLVQAFIQQSPQLDRFNPTSINTLRVISFLFQDQVHILSSILRIGAPHAQVDNFHQGGSSRQIHPDGSLSSCALYASDYDYHPVEDQGEIIQGYDQVIHLIKKVHPRFPHLRWLGWDFAIGRDYQPIFIEMNPLAWHNQGECGPSFGDMTREVLDEYFASKS